MGSVDSEDDEDPTGKRPAIDHIDHGVINVPVGQLTAAVDWYVQRFGFQPRQEFTIDTPWSGLRSQVLAHPNGGATLPINEPTTANSQVQEFLHWNRGPGIQHVALHTHNIIQTVGHLQDRGVQFLDVPHGYYQALTQRPGYGVRPSDSSDRSRPNSPQAANPPYLASHPLLDELVRLNILVDWDSQTPQAKLLQTFTQPVFDQPTLFFEIIQRQSAWAGAHPILAQGFGERNFQALFEAIEQEQRKRGSLV
jgi:4-hydroxyphenylpyruvate dioxygenase